MIIGLHRTISRNILIYIETETMTQNAIIFLPQICKWY